MIGDSHAALVGHGCYEPGAVKATYGTGSSLMMLSPGLVKEQKSLARTIAWSLPNKVQYALEGNIAMSGAALHWVGEFLGLPHPAEDAAVLAETVPSAEGLILVPAMVGLGAPYWDSTARGIVANLERSHKAAHLARASLDAIAMQVADVLEAMEEEAGVKLPVLLADGGATKNETLMQLQADVLQRRIQRSAQEELSARGTAMLGGLALGWWCDMDAISALPTAGDCFEPKMDDARRVELRRRWQLAVVFAPAISAQDRTRLKCKWKAAFRRMRSTPEARS
jgi:glycerol kinase